MHLKNIDRVVKNLETKIEVLNIIKTGMNGNQIRPFLPG
jgi:hypothetical protein